MGELKAFALPKPVCCVVNSGRRGNRLSNQGVRSATYSAVYFAQFSSLQPYVLPISLIAYM